MSRAFATHRIEAGSDIRTAQELLGDRNAGITMADTHALHRDPAGVTRPLDRLA